MKTERTEDGWYFEEGNAWAKASTRFNHIELSYCNCGDSGPEPGEIDAQHASDLIDCLKAAIRCLEGEPQLGPVKARIHGNIAELVGDEWFYENGEKLWLTPNADVFPRRSCPRCGAPPQNPFLDSEDDRPCEPCCPETESGQAESLELMLNAQAARTGEALLRAREAEERFESLSRLVTFIHVVVGGMVDSTNPLKRYDLWAELIKLLEAVEKDGYLQPYYSRQSDYERWKQVRG